MAASAPKTKWESKLSALQTQRRKMGLCIKCGDKWGRNHTCPAQIPLHIMEELWDVVHFAQVSDDDHSSTQSDEDLLALSLATTEGF
jgi:hypothetical protein